MAVLVRSAQRQVPVLRRALAAAGVPVTVAGDELPLPDEPGVRPLLPMLLRCALEPGKLTDEIAAELLTGPLGQTDSLGLRKLRRALDELLSEAIETAEVLNTVSDRVSAPARRVAALLEAARQAIAADGTAEDVLWAIWDASGLAERWERLAAAEHDPAGRPGP